eukprot:3564171-Rhodomonas_salina.3
MLVTRPGKLSGVLRIVTMSGIEVAHGYQEISTLGDTALFTTTPQSNAGYYGYDYYSNPCGSCDPFNATFDSRLLVMNGIYPAVTAREVRNVCLGNGSGGVGGAEDAEEGERRHGGMAKET